VTMTTSNARILGEPPLEQGPSPAGRSETPSPSADASHSRVRSGSKQVCRRDSAGPGAAVRGRVIPQPFGPAGSVDAPALVTHATKRRWADPKG
jgi:hypothetical protein